MGCILTAFGQNKVSYTTLKERSDKAIQEKNTANLLAVEKDFDAFYADVSNRTAEAKFQYALVKIHVAYDLILSREFTKAEETLLTVISLSENFPKMRTKAYSALGQCYSYMALEKEAHDNFEDAIQYSLLSISYSSMAQKSERVLEQYIKLGREYTRTRQFDKARVSFDEAALRMPSIADSIKYVASLLLGKAEMEKQQENYGASVDLFIQLFHLYEKNEVPLKETKMLSTAQSITNLYRFSLHNDEKADYWERISYSLRDVPSKDKSDKEGMLSSKHQMDDILKMQIAGRYTEAIPRYQQLIHEAETHPTADNQFMRAECYKNSGLCYLQLRQYPEAIKHLNTAAAAYRSLHKLPDAVDCYTYGSYAYYHQKEISKAIESSQEALKTAQECFDNDSKQLADCYLNAANLYAFHNDTILAKQHLLKALEIKEKDIHHTFSYLTSQEREKYWSTMQADILNAQPFFLKLNEKQSLFTDAMYDIQLLTKGLLLQSDVELQLLSKSSPQLRAALEQLITVRKQLMQENLSADQRLGLKQEAETLERRLTKDSKEAGDFLHFLDVTHREVKQALPPHALAIEFATFRYRTDSMLTVAYAMKKEWGHVMVIPLFEKKEIQALLGRQPSSATSINRSYVYNADGATLSQLVWGGILPHLDAGDTIYFAPSDLLHQLAIEHLPYDETHTMNEVYTMVRLSSTRELAMHKKTTTITTATLYGDIAYQEMDTTVMLALSTKYNDGTRTVTRSSRLIDTSEDFEPMLPLPGTKVEIQSIEPILQKEHIAVHVYAQQEACEESVKALSGKKQNILHIATHGFFQPDNGQNSDPMNRCGLYFAGVDKVLVKGNIALPQNVDDGILTAKEISLLDLRNAELVVLSACETGLGDISGDGVFGLQRAFKQAGTQTIIMSLWPVNDAATQLLMTEFYRNWITLHQPKRKAFRNAQNTVRARYEQPIYWAGFIILD